MRLFPYLIVLIMLFGLSCSDIGRKVNKEEVLDRSTMIRLMADIEITEAALKFKQATVKRDSLKLIANKAYDSLYLYYKTTPTVFRNSLKYYQGDLEEYVKMLDEKITLLTQKQDSIKLEGDAIKSDSIGADINRVRIEVK